MGFYFGTIGDSIRKSLNGSYLINVLLLFIATIVLFGISFVIILIPAIASIAFFQFSIAGLFVLLLLVIVFLLMLSFIGAICAGIGYNLGKQHWNASNISISQAWSDSKSRLMALFKVELVVAIIVLIVIGIALLPFFLSLINVAQEVVSAFSTNGGNVDEAVFLNVLFSLLPVLGTLLLGFLLLVILFLIFLPFFYLYPQTALFENANTSGSIKRALHYMKKNYGMNWIMIFMYAVVIFLIFIPVFFIVAALGPLGFIVNMIFSFWTAGLAYLFGYKLYQINAERQ